MTPDGRPAAALAAWADVLVWDGSGFVWADDGTPEPHAHPLTLGDVVPMPQIRTVYRRPFVVVGAEFLQALAARPRAAVERICGDLGEYGPMRAEAGAVLRQSVAIRHAWLVRLDRWQAAMREPIGVAFSPGHALRILDRVARLDREAEEAARVEAALDRCRRMFYATGTPWAPYSTRAARLWGIVEDALAARHGAETPAFLHRIRLAARALQPDFLLYDDELARAFAETVDRIASRGP